MMGVVERVMTLEHVAVHSGTRIRIPYLIRFDCICLNYSAESGLYFTTDI